MVIRSEAFEIFSCYNYILLTEQHVEEERITITYSGIRKSDICLTALGPAYSVENFRLKNGVFNIVFVNDGIRNEGQLKVDDKGYALEIKNSKNVFVEKGVLNKSTN